MGVAATSGGSLIGAQVTAQPPGETQCGGTVASPTATPCSASYGTVSNAVYNQVTFSFSNLANTSSDNSAQPLTIVFPAYVLNNATNQGSVEQTGTTAPSFSLASYTTTDNPSSATTPPAAGRSRWMRSRS